MAAASISLAGCQPSDPPVNTANDTGLKNGSKTARQPTTTTAGRRTPRPPRPTAGVRFVEVAARSGVSFRFHNDQKPGRFFLPEVMGGGVAWLDYDVDGRIDLFCINGGRLDTSPPDASRHPDRLFHNLGSGQFLHAKQALPKLDRGFGQGVAAGDANGDGFPDLFLACYGPDRLLLNNGDGTFSVSPAPFTESSRRWSTSVAWLDCDGDKDLDLFVAGYLALDLNNHQPCQYDNRPGYCGPGRFAAVPDALYLNNGDGTFTESAAALGLAQAAVDAETTLDKKTAKTSTRRQPRARAGKSLAVAVVDLDHDTRPEIYVGNDLTPNHLYTISNPHDLQLPVYHDVAIVSGSAHSAEGENEASMGIACGDFDRDGRFDLFLTHYFQKKNTLYRNLTLTLTPNTTSPAAPGSKQQGLAFYDESRRSRVSATSYAFLGFGTVAIDVDRDNDLDLFVANGHVLGPNHPPSAMTAQLLANDGTGRFTDVSTLSGNYFQRDLLGRGVAAADLDNDGDIDIAVSHLDAPLALLRNDSPTIGDWVGLVVLGPRIGGRVELISGHDAPTQIVPLVSAGSYLSDNDPRVVLTLPKGSESAVVRVHRPGQDSREYHGLKTGRYWLLPVSGPALEMMR